MNIEITPAVLITLVLAIVGAVWALSRMLSGVVSKDDLHKLDIEIINRINLRDTQSTVARASLASKDELAQLRRDLGENFREFKTEVKEDLGGLSAQYHGIEKKYDELLKSIAGLAHQLTARKPNG